MTTPCLYCGADPPDCVDWSNDAAVYEHEIASWRERRWLKFWDELGQNYPLVGIEICPGCFAALDEWAVLAADGRLWQLACLMRVVGIHVEPPRSPNARSRWEKSPEEQLAEEQRRVEARTPERVWAEAWDLTWRLMAAGARAKWVPVVREEQQAEALAIAEHRQGIFDLEKALDKLPRRS